MMSGTVAQIVGAIFGIAIVVWAARRWLLKRHFVWRVFDISATIVRDDEHLKIGQFLNLEQRLRPGESGWTNMKINIPERWIVRAVVPSANGVTLTLLDGTEFHLHRRNVGPLSFEILDGGDDKPDHDHELIWKKYAAAA
jgi:hypothetical protein